MVRAPRPRVCVRASDADADGDLEARLAREFRRRGIRSSLQQLEEEGPSAFKDPAKVVEFVMLCLQHREDAGLAQAFRFTSAAAGTQSFVHGVSDSTPRTSWVSGKVIGRFVSGVANDLAGFSRELRAEFPMLLACDAWRFASPPTTLSKEEDGWIVQFLLDVRKGGSAYIVAVRLLYDWGSWCFLIFNVKVLQDPGGDAALEKH
ncbi:hypothetical protein KFE25_001290 [Diacronema lutheri]|uniref:Uncharacterized protein n=2 Tax=Diacronema lutheri TaxID=2081491 RepID=A0A8J5XID4_DIALT|nr:hypothetical protein KFE25_001290 [Diacronema lutheri]